MTKVFSDLSVLVIGDLVLDGYTWGVSERVAEKGISPISGEEERGRVNHDGD